MPTLEEREEAKARRTLQSRSELQIFTDGSARNDEVGYGIATLISGRPGINHHRTIGNMNEANTYIVEPGAIAEAVSWAKQVLDKFPGK